ncbi:MAG: hypothetical protein FWJ62_04585 [Thermaerobacter sp.]|nr:hypothetical protein [Bacillota bacterium]REJ34312.1 MAG: hypothetical protein DIU84_07935 [Bacillota bacterium]
MDDPALARVFGGQAVPAAQPVPEDFRSLPRAEQRRRLVALIEGGRSDEEIGRLLGMSQWQVRNLRYRLGIKKDRGGNVYLESPDRKGGAAAGAARAAGPDASAPFTLNLQGVYDAETLSRRLAGLRALLEAGAPERRYEVRLELTEVTPEPSPAASG